MLGQQLLWRAWDGTTKNGIPFPVIPLQAPPAVGADVFEFYNTLLDHYFITADAGEAAGYQAGLAAPMTWMTTIVRNKAFDLLRRVDDVVEIDADNSGRRSNSNLACARPRAGDRSGSNCARI